MDVSKIGKASDQLRSLPRSAKKMGKLWSTNKKVIEVIGAHVDPPTINTARAV